MGSSSAIDLSECVLLTDDALRILKNRTGPTLTTLKLNECYHITDRGLRVLTRTLHASRKRSSDGFQILAEGFPLLSTISLIGTDSMNPVLVFVLVPEPFLLIFLFFILPVMFH